MLPKPLPVIAAALLLLLVSGGAAALGLGAMRTQSALNQPFYAEIELTGVRPDEIDAVRARLASRDDFSKAGTERPHFLTRLRFNAAIGTDGRPYIQVSSSEPIREPYIDFLVEVLWPQGRLVKEYTVLMDPPARGRSAPPRVVPPSTSTVAQRRPPPEPEPAPAMRRSAREPERQALPPAPVPAPAPVPPEARGTRFPLYYGPVPRGATLTRIARDLTPPGATAEQTAMALFRNNQDAFMRGSINRLRVGVDLVVPTAEELFALDQATARRQFQDALAGRSVNTSPITDVSGDAQLRIAGADGAAGTAQAGAPLAPTLQNDLLMVQETTESNRQETAELRSRISELEQQLVDIQRLLSLRNEQLAQLQQTARDGASGAGAQPLPTPAPPASAAPPALLPVPPAEPFSAAAPDGSDRAPAEPIVEPGIGIVGPDGVVQELLPPPLSEPAAAPAGSVAGGAPQARGDGTAGTTAAAEDSGTTAIAAPAEEEADQPPWSAALEGVGHAARAVPAWALGVVAGSLGLGALGLVAYRRRRQLTTAYAADGEPDMAATGSAAVAPGAAAPADFDEQPSTADPLQLDTLPDLSSEMPLDAGGSRTDSEPAIDAETGLPVNVVSNIPHSQLETQEADVIAEADIYILYGRYREAEALLREELERMPDRPDLKYKLGEALVGSGNREALAALLQDMRVSGDDARDAAKWASLQSGLAGLGDAPDADDTPTAPPPRVRPADAGSRVTASAPALSADPIGSTELPDDDDTDLGFSVREVSPSSADRLREQMADLELDLQELDAFGGSLESTQAGDGSASPPGYTEDLPGVAPSGAPVDLETPPSPPTGGAPATGGSPLDLDLDALEELTATPADSAPADLTLPVPDELPGIGPRDADEAAEGVRRARGAAGNTRDETLAPLPDPLGREPSLTVAEPAAADGLSDEAPVGAPVEDSISSDVLSSQWRMDSGLWDEAGTKMDLARAYIEMDDPDAARAILDEVMLEGSESQRAEASALLAKLG